MILPKVWLIFLLNFFLFWEAKHFILKILWKKFILKIILRNVFTDALDQHKLDEDALLKAAFNIADAGVTDFN